MACKTISKPPRVTASWRFICIIFMLSGLFEDFIGGAGAVVVGGDADVEALERLAAAHALQVVI